MLRKMLFTPLPLLALICVMFSLTACTEEPAAPPPALEPPAKRIISLAPALTQILVDLEMSEYLVGVAENDMAAPGSLPIVGNAFDPDYEKISQLKPTHVFTMSGDSQNRLSKMAEEQGFVLAVYRYPQTEYDVYNIIFGGGSDHVVFGGHKEGTGMGQVLDIEAQANQLTRSMVNQFRAISNVTSKAANLSQNVLILIEVDSTVTASGPKTFYDHILFTYVKAFNAAATSLVQAPSFSREKLAEHQPPIDAIVLILPGAQPLGDIDRDPRLEIFRGLDIPAIKNKRVYLINDPLAKLPSSSLPQIAARIAKAVHPDLSDRIDQAMQLNDVEADLPLADDVPDSSQNAGH